MTIAVDLGHKATKPTTFKGLIEIKGEDQEAKKIVFKKIYCYQISFKEFFIFRSGGHFVRFKVNYTYRTKFFSDIISLLGCYQPVPLWSLKFKSVAYS